MADDSGPYTGIDYPDEVEETLKRKGRAAKAYLTVYQAMEYDPDGEIYDGILRQSSNEKFRILDVDAKLIEENRSDFKAGRYSVRHFRNLKEYCASSYFAEYFKERMRMRRLVESQRPADWEKLTPNQRYKRLREGTFDTAPFPDELTTVSPGLPNFDVNSGRAQEFIPTISGPYNKQLYLFDFLDHHSKAFEAYHHNPWAKRAVQITPQFVLGKGVRAHILGQGPDKEKVQAAWDSFWKRNRMKMRAKMVLAELILYGEQFLRYFSTREGLVVRQMDPSTIWEVVTDPDDIERQYYAHLQYPTLFQSFVNVPVPTIKFIIRQVPAPYYDHYKVNAVSNEKRGRSELFAVLGWLKRFKEWANDRVILGKMQSMFAWDLSVKGSADDVQAALNLFKNPQTPGSVYAHNDVVELQAARANISAARDTGDEEMLMRWIAAGVGISPQYLGLSSDTTKAAALIGIEPDTKHFEDYQERMEMIFQDMARRVQEEERRRGRLAKYYDFEFLFPEFRQEDKTQELKNIAFGEAMSWWSHRRASEMAVQQQKIQAYDYDEEMAEIQKERQEGITISKEFAQVLKGEDAEKAAGGGGEGGRPPEGMAMGEFGTGDYEAPDDEYNEDTSQGSADMAQWKDKQKTMSTQKATNYFPSGDKL